MSDIRLKKITAEPNNGSLIIQNSNVNITDTSISNNILNGALIVNGGIGINCSYDSISSTSGGALSVGGGLSVNKQTYLGNNLILDNNLSTVTINGVTTNRLFLDSVSNKNFYLSVDGITKQFSVTDTSVNINITTNSTNMSSGSLVVNGGISINSTYDAINSSNGGSLTVGGGVSIGGNTILSKTLTIYSTLYSTYLGTSGSQIALQNSLGNYLASFNMLGNDLYINNGVSIGNINMVVSSGNLNFINSGTTLQTIKDNRIEFNKFIIITDTTNSINSSIGSFVNLGGISISCSSDSSSSTSGGAMTIEGGLAINKKTFTGDSLGLEVKNGNKNNKLVLYQLNGDLTQNNLFTGIGNISNGSMKFTINSMLDDYIFTSSSSDGSSSNTVFRIKGTNEVQFTGYFQKYSILGGGDSNTSLTLQGQGSGDPMSFNLFTADGDSNDSIDLKIVSLGSPNVMTNSEYLKIGWDKNIQKYILSTINTGSGINRNIILQCGNNVGQLELNTNGTLKMSSTTVSTSSSSGALVLNGGISINNTNDSVSFTEGGAMTLAGGLSINKTFYVRNNINMFSSSGNITFSTQNSKGDLLLSNPSSYYSLAGNGGTTNNISLSLFNLNNSLSGDYECFRIHYFNDKYNLESSVGGTGKYKSLQINTGTTLMYMSTSGNIGINNNTPQFTLDINGTLRSNGYSYMNELTVYSTLDATTINSSGSLTVLGGGSIAKTLYVGGKIYCNDTSNASLGTGSVVLAGGLSVNNGQDANYSSGALTVAGGCSVGKDLYVSQNLYVLGSINGAQNSSTSFSYLLLTTSDPSTSLNNGALIAYGGLTTKSYVNAVNVSNGGSFLTPGGASIGKDLYLGGNFYSYGVINMYNNVESLINLYDNQNNLKFSLNRNISTNDFSISRYNTSGNLIEKSFSINYSSGSIYFNNTTSSINSSTGSVVLYGGLSINTTTNSSSVQNGGALTVNGGASINKDMYVGGNVVFSSSTQSSNASNGSLVVSGGVGISGNMNILGNAVIAGNLTVMGTTTSINSVNTTLTDNILILNSGPAGTKDSGYIIQRYQLDNNTGSGDVVNDNAYFINNLPLQTGMTNTQIKFNTDASSVDNYYKGWWVKVTSGLSVNQVRQITSYSGGSRIAALSSAWNSQNPTLGDTVSLYNKPYIGVVFSELYRRFEFGGTTQDPGSSSIDLTDTLPIYFSGATSTSTQPSTSANTGAIITNGGIGISCTTNSTSITSGGALTVAGGCSIAKTLNVSSVYVNSVNITPNLGDIMATTVFTAANNISSPANITGLIFNNDVWGADIYLSARLTATTNLYANYTIKIVNQNGSWDLVTTYVGSNILSFSITNSGQLQYTTGNFPGFVSLIFKFKAITN